MVRGPRESIDWSCDDDVVFSGPRIGVKRLHEIVRGKLDAHSMIKRNTKAGSSENTLKRLFQRFDKDRSGSIDMNEFFALLKTVGLQNINKNDATDLFTKYDSDGNGSLDFSEWCKSMEYPLTFLTSQELSICRLRETISSLEERARKSARPFLGAISPTSSKQTA